jgi:hypothetical protein
MTNTNRHIESKRKNVSTSYQNAANFATISEVSKMNPEMGNVGETAQVAVGCCVVSAACILLHPIMFAVGCGACLIGTAVMCFRIHKKNKEKENYEEIENYSDFASII